MARPTTTANTLFSGVPVRPTVSAKTAPRLVENIMKHTYRTYQDSSVGGDWTDFPDATAAITYGASTDGGQWFEFTTTAGGIQRVWTSMNIPMANNTKYIVSFTVDSRTGTISAGGNANVSLQTDHATGKVRGLLCLNCNTALGQLKDSVSLLLKAADYLEGYK